MSGLLNRSQSSTTPAPPQVHSPAPSTTSGNQAPAQAPTTEPPASAQLANQGADATVTASLEKVRRMIARGRSLGMTQAAANLEHWLGGNGSTRTMPAAAFSGEGFIRSALRDPHLRLIQEGARRRVRDGVIGPTNPSYTTYWEDSVYARPLTDLFFALGGFTLRSDVTVTLDPTTQRLRVTSWSCTASDLYNWDAGKATNIPGFGTIEDAELLALESAGYGRAFNVTSEPWTPADPTLFEAFQ